jgi:hypothetical protein
MRRPVTMRFVVGVACLALAVAGCGGGKSGSASGSKPQASSSAKASVRWPAPSDPLARSVAAGLKPEVKESLTFHVHAHLDVFVNGKPVTVPAGIGINTTDRG